MPPPALCPLCNAPSPVATGRTHTESAGTYRHFACSSCLVEFWWPLQNPGAAWYSEAKKYGDRNSDPVWNATANHKRVLSYLEGEKGSVLDVGCGIGNFLVAAKARGWKCTGIDFDVDAIESARRVTGTSDFEATDVVSYAAAHPEKKFDLVTFFDVLEHVDNHNDFLDSIKKLLKPAGYIAMSMPYREHAIWLMKGDVPPNHLTCWDEASLRIFLEKHGFEIVRIQRNPASLWTILMKMRFKYGKSLSFGAVSAVRHSIGDKADKPGKRPLLVRVVHALAKTKDAVLFGIPAVLIYIAMIPTRKRYDDLLCIAQLK